MEHFAGHWSEDCKKWGILVESTRPPRRILSNRALEILIHLYRVILSPHLGGNCRFIPSCSEYAIHALQYYPSRKALALIFRRLLNCRPGGPSGFDPVPIERCEKRL